MSLELLEEYIQNGDALNLEKLLRSSPELAKATTSYSITPLLLSCYLNKKELSEIILSYLGEADIFEAAALGKFDSIANWIYQHPELINSYSGDGFTPLGLSCYFAHEEITRYLLLKGADVNLPSQNGHHVFPLHSSVAANNADITKILLEAGAEVNIRQQSGITPLHLAAQNGNIEILILLLEAGASVSSKMEDGRTPSVLASEKGFHEIARILAE